MHRLRRMFCTSFVSAIYLPLISVAEASGTIIVSCAPALSSFWNNIFTKSKLYSSLHTGLLSRTSRTSHTSRTSRSSRSSHWASGKSGTAQHTRDKPDPFESLSYLELDVPYHQPVYVPDQPGISRTKIYSSDSPVPPKNDVISKSTVIKQSSERGSTNGRYNQKSGYRI